MKRIKDFIYNFSDIFITLLVIALASGVILWRVQLIMGYSENIKTADTDKKIDIDFSDVDLTIDPDPEYDPSNPGEKDPADEPHPGEIDIENLVINENFTAYKSVYVSIPAGASFDKAVRLLASAFDELSAEQYATLYSLLWNRGVALGADTKIQIDTFAIEQGTNIDDMMNIICRGQLF